MQQTVHGELYLNRKIFLKMRKSRIWHLLSLAWLPTTGWHSSTGGQKDRVCCGDFCSTNRTFRPGAPGSIWLISSKCLPKVSSLPRSLVWALTGRNAPPQCLENNWPGKLCSVCTDYNPGLMHGDQDSFFKMWFNLSFKLFVVATKISQLCRKPLIKWMKTSHTQTQIKH